MGENEAIASRRRTPSRRTKPCAGVDLEAEPLRVDGLLLLAGDIRQSGRCLFAVTTNTVCVRPHTLRTSALAVVRSVQRLPRPARALTTSRALTRPWATFARAATAATTRVAASGTATTHPRARSRRRPLPR